MRVKYIKLRHKVYWFVRRPPKNLQDQLGSKTICINLHTRDWAVALTRKDAILTEWDALVVTPDPTDDYDNRCLLSEYIEQLNDNKEKEPQDARKVP
jgi:hypothetical protein|tara:strand:- start:2539 stop:2829 length:291 start_codon:yes stop_codon:yes gene_type:complete